MKLSPRNLILSLVISVAPVTGAGAFDGEPRVTFAELNFDTYAAGFTLDAVREGRFEHPYGPPVDISDFDWKTTPVNKVSWWIRIEELRFLIPLIASGAWREPMTVARRGMVLVYWHERALAVEAPDTVFLRILQMELERHALHLMEHFDADSNHGLEEAMGMIELSRVVDLPPTRAKGFERLSSMVSALVSGQGVPLEHSPGYHFLMLQTLRRHGSYLRTLEWTPEDTLAQIDETDSLQVLPEDR